ncbi:MAG: sensor histidine kinase response regulator [Myxococcaceae bacterium]|nr:sensor histidine kinase response regulator [Myxococcaceae bacterium]
MSADPANLGVESVGSSAAQVRALTERVRALESELAGAREVEESERRFRRIVETTAEGVWLVDVVNVTTFVNPAMAQMLGLLPEQMLGRPMFDFMPQESHGDANQNVERRMHGIREVHEFPLRHVDGREVWTIMTTSPVYDDAGNYQGALAMVTDATKKREAERERDELSARMVESQKVESLGVLAGGIAHDFNNLLAAIMGHVEIASQEPTLTARSHTALAHALAASQRAAGLTRQLLDYAGRSEVALKPIRLARQAVELVELLRASIPKRVSLEFVTSDPELAIMADPDRLQQATMNLVINAAESYGAQAGQVIVQVAREEVGPHGLSWLRSPDRVAPGPYVFLEVRDYGLGMSESTLRRVFEPFFTTKTSGRGLGLAATLGIVRAHGGHVTVRSKQGHGTTFRAYFPLCRENEAQVTEPTASLPTTTLRARTLLVVDDEPMVREFAQRLLETEGYQVLEAGSGGEALALLREHSQQIDGVLLDLSMPGMDGDALLSELRSFAPNLPVIVHSGHSIESTSERLLQWNIAGVLQKPYRAARLSEMVRGLFGEASA